MHIFAHPDLDPRIRRRRRLPSILYVCRLWRTLILQTPAFWVKLLGSRSCMTEDPRWKVDRLRFALNHSLPHSFSLNWRGCAPSVVDALLHHSERISALTIVIAAKDADGLDRLLSAPLPKLECLAIRQRVTYDWKPDYNEISPRWGPRLICTSLPRLRSLTLPRIHFGLQCASPLLRELTLTGCICHDIDRLSPNLDLLLDALEQCSNIETLRVLECLPQAYPRDDDVDASEARDSAGASPRVIRLQLLSCLEVRDNAWHINAFLSHLQFRSTAVLELRFLATLDDGPLVLLRPLPKSLRVGPAIVCAESLSIIQHSTDYIELETSTNGSPRLRLAVWNSWDNRLVVAGAVIDAFASSGTITSLAVQSRSMKNEDWSRLLSHFPQLTRLTIEAVDGRLDALPLLCNHRAEDGGYLCPRLRSLGFYWRSFYDYSIWRREGRPLATMNAGDLERVTEESDSEVETDHPDSWQAYGPHASAAFSRTVKVFLSTRAALGAPLRELTVFIADLAARSWWYRKPWDLASTQGWVSKEMEGSDVSVSVCVIPDMSEQ
ncbi:hypothetical protein C8Q76DRAFT_678217 [Earliella scabrosa]|nr:hypothetical protein C8Q76DRAFT_678217 [Earliella scabrosa]